MGEEQQQQLSSPPKRFSQRLAKHPSVEEIEQLPPMDTATDLIGNGIFPADSKIVRSCAPSRNNNNINNNNEKEILDDGTTPTRHTKFGNTKNRSNGISQRSKNAGSHATKNNNNHLKEEEFEKRFEEKKFEDLQRKLTDSIRSRDEAAAAVTILPADLRPSLETNGNIDIGEQQRLHSTTIDYRISDLSNCTSVIAQPDTLGCELTADPNDFHDSKARVKLKTDDDEMGLSNGLVEPMDTYIPIVGDISQPLLDDSASKKVFLTDSSDSMDGPLCNGQDLEDKRRKREDKKDDRNKKKKLKPLEEENLSK